MNLEKLKDAARKHEQKEDWRKAIDVYQKAIQQFEAGREADLDLALYNRVGDLYLKLNDPANAVQSYERAAELYGEQGFLNNAIALCGKVLRVNPGRVQIYLQLAHLHARKNVVSETKRNLIEYIERMNTLAKLDDAFQQLKTFADQHSGNQDIRMMLVELLRAASRTDEAREQLEKMAGELEARGDRAGARRTRERITTMPAHGAAPATPAKGEGGLVFIETGMDLGAPARNAPTAPMAPVAGLELNEPPIAEPDETGAPIAGLDRFEPAPMEIETSGGAPVVAGLEPDSFEGPQATDVPQLDGLLRESAEQLDAEAAGGSRASDADDDLVIVHETPSEIMFGESGLATLGLDPAFEQSAPELDDTVPNEFNLVGEAPLALTGREDEFAGGEEEPGATLDFIPATESAGAAAIEELEDRILDNPDDPALHLALADALVGVGDSTRAIEEYGLAAQGFETRSAWESALDAVDALLRLEPDAIRYQQKRVELAYRSGDRSRLVGAYLDLAETLVRAGAPDKAAAVYGRILEHEPGNARAREGMAMVAPPPPPAPAPPPSVAAERKPVEAAEPTVPAARTESPPARAPSPPPAGFVDLGSLVIEAEGPRDTRMRTEQERPTGDEQKDFLDTLEQFKKGIEANLGTEDYEAHYDLGVAYKEMGLLDEAIAEFQKALRAPAGRMRTSEALGVTFFEKGQFAIAETILRRAVESLEGGDDAKVGLLYWLGRTAEEQGKVREARAAYERALAVDIRFKDLAGRVQALAAASP